MKRLILSVAVLAVFTFALEGQAVEFVVTPLTDNDTFDANCNISGTNVVWRQESGGYDSNEIMLYDGATTFQITDNDVLDWVPRIDGPNLVWFGYDGPSAGWQHDWEVYYYNHDTRVTTRLTDNGYHDYYPQVSGSNVVWEARVGGNTRDHEIMLYDGGTTHQLTNDSYNDRSPRISGSNIVWQKNDGNDWEIFLYDGTNTTQLTDNSYSDSRGEVSGSRVVWQGGEDDAAEIYLYDRSGTTRLTDNSRSDIRPLVSATDVFWQGHDGNDWEIFRYDGANITQVTDNTFDDHLTDASGSNAVWYGGGTNPSQDEIFFYDGATGTIVQLTDDDFEDRGPWISGYSVVWEGRTPDMEVFLATPVPEPSTSQWQLTGVGSYNDSSNWTTNVVPDGVAAVANFLHMITSNSLVSVNSPVTVGTINFDNADYNYTIDGPSSITLEGFGQNSQINVRQGHHTISAPLSLVGGLTLDTQAGTRLTLNLESLAVVSAAIAKESPGRCVIDGGLAVLGEINVNGGMLEIGADLLANPGGSISIAEGATLKASGTVNRYVIGVPGSILEATGTAAIGLLGAEDGYNFQGHLEVGPQMVGLRDANWAQVYETHIDGGSLSSFNGIGLQPVKDFWTTLVTKEGWLTGNGDVHGSVRLEADVITGDMAAIAGDGPGQEIILDGVVSGSGWFEYVKITGLHRPGASAGATSLGPGFNIGPSTAVGIDGNLGFVLPLQNPPPGYDQWFAAMGVHSISGELTINLEVPPGETEIYLPEPSVRYEIFKPFAPMGNTDLIGWYVDWFDTVTLDPTWPSPQDWVWEFDYKDGEIGLGDAPDAGREYWSATLLVVPEPGTLMLLATFGLGLLLLPRRRRS